MYSLKGLLVDQDPKVTEENLDQVGHLGPRVVLDSQDHLDQLAMLDLKDPREDLDHQEALDHPVHPDQQEIKV